MRGQSQRDGKFENSLNFDIIFDLHRSPVSREQFLVKSSISFVRTLHTRTYRPCKWEDMGMHCLATVVCQIWG